MFPVWSTNRRCRDEIDCGRCSRTSSSVLDITRTVYFKRFCVFSGGTQVTEVVVSVVGRYWRFALSAAAAHASICVGVATGDDDSGSPTESYTDEKRGQDAVFNRDILRTMLLNIPPRQSSDSCSDEPNSTGLYRFIP